MERLTSNQKAEVAGKYAQLNELLRQKSALEHEISELMARANSLRQRANEIDLEFHRLAIKVEPTVVCPTPGTRKPKDEGKAMLKTILDRLESPSPSMVEQLEKLLNL